MVRSLAAKELAIMELGELLCALNIVSGSGGGGEGGGKEAEPRGADRWTDGKIDGARFEPPLPPPGRPFTGHVTWGHCHLPASVSLPSILDSPSR